MAAPRHSKKSQPYGFWTLIGLVVANMIGAGLYTSSGYALAGLGDAKYVLEVWLIGGIIAMCGAVGYGALAARLPMAGGEYLYLSRLVHPSVGFLAGWISLIAGFTAPIAAAALVVGEYSVPDSMQKTLAPKFVATGTILLAGIAHSVHLKSGAWLQNLIVLLKMVCLTLFLVLALVFGPEKGWQSGILESHEVPHGPTAVLITTMLGSLLWISLSYTGFNAAVYLAGEIPRGEKLVPRSMLIATLIVTLFYLSLNAVFLYAIPASELAGKKAFVADVARAVGGGSLEGLIRLAIVLSSMTSVLAMLMAGPRVYAQMAADRVMPKLFAMKRGIPRRAIIVQAGLSTIVIWISKLEELIAFLGLTLSACGALSIASIWWLPRKLQNANRIRWYEHLCSAIFVVTSIVLLFVARTEKPKEFWACIVTFALGGLIYWLARRLSNPADPLASKSTEPLSPK